MDCEERNAGGRRAGAGKATTEGGRTARETRHYDFPVKGMTGNSEVPDPGPLPLGQKLNDSFVVKLHRLIGNLGDPG